MVASTFNMSHLYNMVLHESSEAVQWEDMEYLIKLHGPD